MKNRRNTRRGRARRWKDWGDGFWYLRGSGAYPRGMMVDATHFHLGGLKRWGIGFNGSLDASDFPSRAAAMRAADHLARRR